MPGSGGLSRLRKKLKRGTDDFKVQILTFNINTCFGKWWPKEEHNFF